MDEKPLARRIRITHLIPSLEIGGAEQSLVKLVTGLDPQVFEQRVISMIGGGALASKLEAVGIPLESLGMRRGQPSPRAYWRLRRSLRGAPPDVLQTWLYHADLLGTIAVGRATRPSLVWNVRCSNMDLTQYRSLTRLVLFILSRWAFRPLAVLVNSEAGRRYHAALGYAPRRWEVIPNGFDTERFRPDSVARDAIRRELAIPPQAPIVGLVARHDPAKDHRTFLEAARLVHTACPLTRFILIGSGIPALREAVSAQGLASHVHLLDARSDIERVMAAFDVGCLASAWGEGFPNVLGEMMACGVPCVTTRVGDAATIIGTTGEVVSPGDATALATALIGLCSVTPAARARLGAAARARIQADYSLAVVLARYADFYHSLADVAALAQVNS